MSNHPEFSWEYSHGGSQGNNYSQGMNGSAPGGGRQWLHSNQANTANAGNTGYMQRSDQSSFSTPDDPFAAYNQSMFNQYGNFKPSYGDSQMGPAMVDGMSLDPSQGMGNGMEQSMGMDQGMGQSMGQGVRNGLGSMGGNHRLSGGSSKRSNGLNQPPRSYRGSWF